jgi:hypothetical protein
MRRVAEGGQGGEIKSEQQDREKPGKRQGTVLSATCRKKLF